MEVRHNLHCIAPVKTEVVLPSINIPIKIPVNPLLGCTFTLLSDNNLMKSDNLVFPTLGDPEQFTKYNRIHSEVNTGLAYQSNQGKIRNVKNSVQIPFIL